MVCAEGCTIGCKACDGNGTRIPNIDHCPDERPPGFEALHMPGALHPRCTSPLPLTFSYKAENT